MKSTYKYAYIKDNAIVILGTFIAYFKAIILMPLIIKTMGVTVYGGYVLFISLLSIVFGISTFGVGIKARRFLPSCKTMDERGKLFYPQLIFVFCTIVFFSVLLFCLNDHISSFLFKNKLNYSALIFPAYLLAYFLYAQGLDYLRYTSRTHYMTLANIVFPYLAIGIIMLVLLATGSISINTLVISEAISATLLGLIFFTIIIRELGTKISPYSARELIAEIKLGTPLMFTVIIDFILAASDRYIISIFLSVSAVGLYNPAYLLGSLVMIIPKAMGTAIPQLMSKAIDGGEQNAAELMLDYTIKVFLFLAIPFIFGAAVLSKEVLILLANAEVAQTAALVTPVVALGIVFYGLTSIMSNILFVQLRTGLMFKVNLLAAALNLSTNIIFLYFFRNIMVAALTTLLSYFVSFLYLNHKVKAVWKIGYDLKFIVKVTLSSLLMAISVLGLSFLFANVQSALKLGLLIIVSIIIYIVSLVFFKLFTRQEIDFFKETIGRKPPLGKLKKGKITPE